MPDLPNPVVHLRYKSEGGTGGAGTATDTVNWKTIARCLAFGSPYNTPNFEKAIEKALYLGATPFEVISGVPYSEYGARVTFNLPADKWPLLHEIGVDNLPWGLPDWLGLRFRAGEVRWKAYHRSAPRQILPFPRDFSRSLRHCMSSRYQGAVEEYFGFPGECSWGEFVSSCIAALEPRPAVPPFKPHPRPVKGSFCVSVELREGITEAITILADERSLPDDDTIRREWVEDLPQDEAVQYELAYAAVRACGLRRRGSWHAMLAWTVDRSGQWRRAVSFRLPAPLEANHASPRQQP